MKVIVKIFFIAFFLCQSGCVPRELIGARNPDFQNIKYKTILVWFSIHNVDKEVHSESFFVQCADDSRYTNRNVERFGSGSEHKLYAFDANFFEAHKIFFPGKEYTDKEVITKLKKNNFDALLIVNYYKGDVETNITQGTTSWILGTAYKDEETTKLEQIRAKLIDIKSSETVWISDFEGTQIDDDYVKQLFKALITNKLLEVNRSLKTIPKPSDNNTSSDWQWKTH
jgi:hypothetical protein